MIAGTLIGFLVWFLLLMCVYGFYALKYGTQGMTLKPNYGGMVVLMLLGATIGFFL